jgi:antitoxin component YwqK of YwqJK toxin-antitoxin module
MLFKLLPLLTLFALNAKAQCLTYKLASNGDTLNCVDLNGKKQGKWVVEVPKLRAEPAYEEEGEFKDDRKEGTWRKYNMMGDQIAQENYKWGNLNGKCFYFTLNGLEHEESWRALNPDKPYDTIDVQDLLNPNKYERVVVKTEGTSLKHGIWKYYNPNTGAVIDTQEYFMNKIKSDDDAGYLPPVKKNSKPLADSSTKKPITKEIVEFEKKMGKKKNAKVLDGRTY